MLTRNFDSMMVGFLTVFPSSGTPKESDWLAGKPGAVKTHYGPMKSITKFPSSSFSLFGGSNISDDQAQIPTADNITAVPMLLVGKSNAEETYDDYALDLVTELTLTGRRYANITYTADGCVYNTVKTFVNNTENDITVNEVGIYFHFEFNYDVLLYRKKLDKSVTLKANGGTATFNLVIDIPYANKA